LIYSKKIRIDSPQKSTINASEEDNNESATIPSDHTNLFANLGSHKKVTRHSPSPTTFAELQQKITTAQEQLRVAGNINRIVYG